MAPVSRIVGPPAGLGPSRARCARRATALVAAVLAGGCTAAPHRGTGVSIEAVAAADGVHLVERRAPVLFYRYRPWPDREAWRTNYVHPLYSIGGAVLTEDGPADHVHHRGIFWAWRRIRVDGVEVADGWVGERLELRGDAPLTRALDDGSAEIESRLRWVVPVGGLPTPIIEEISTVRAFPQADGHRRVDVTVQLRALRSGVELAGTNDEKGYGGLSFRFAHPDLVAIETGGQRLPARVASLETGTTVSFVWEGLPEPWPSRITVSCTVDGQPWTRWVLRQEPSMQNCAYPGARPVPIPTDRVLTLGATIVVE
jgi:hypothetical protein